MRVKCIHGYFLFYEDYPGDISDFMTLTGCKIVPRGTYYTFEGLHEAPEYSLLAHDILGLPAVATFEGTPWDVFEANGFVFDFTKGLVVPILTVTQRAGLQSGGNVYYSNGLILPGSLSDIGRIKGYDAHFQFSRSRWQYTEVTLV